MANRVNVTSVEVVKDFRASFIVYLAKARATLEEVTSDVGRTRAWVGVNQRVYWEALAKHRKQILDEAQEILLSSKMSSMRRVSASEQMAVAKAKRAYEEAEGKLRIIKRWDRDFENQTQPLARQMEKLHSLLADDAEKAVTYLTQALAALDDYTGMAPPPGLATASSQPGEQKPPDPLLTPEAVPADHAPDNKGAGS